MILEYHRPENIPDALALLSREMPLTLPLGGGTRLSQPHSTDFAVVDLQRLGFNTIGIDGQILQVGSTVTLQQLYDRLDLPEGVMKALQTSLLHETTANLRRCATLGGTIVSCDGRSPLVTALLALDARLTWLPKNESEPLGDYLPLREEPGKNRLIQDIKAPLNVRLHFDMVARSPMDQPIVCAAVAMWPSGRTRIALGGHGSAPILAMDGPEPGGAVVAAREAFRFAGDAWASAEYRMEIAGKLVQRILEKGAA